MLSRDVYFGFVWDHIFKQPSLFDNTLSKLNCVRYSMIVFLELRRLATYYSECSYQQSKYQLRHAYDPDVQVVILHSNHIPKREFMAIIMLLW